MNLIISILLTGFCYLIFPFIYLKTHGKVDKATANKVALTNSIVCAIIFLLLGFVTGTGTLENGISFLPALLYFYIAKIILVDKNANKNKEEKEKKPTSNRNNSNKNIKKKFIKDKEIEENEDLENNKNQDN